MDLDWEIGWWQRGDLVEEVGGWMHALDDNVMHG